MNTKKQTILIVEDNELSREMLTLRLTRSGYTVQSVCDGLAAISAVNKESPNLILMDISLPGSIDGLQVTKKLKSGASTKAIPIIGLSAHALTSDHAKAAAVGCDDYDTKPVNLDRLLEKIGQLI
jgi:two-component system cell cycle response regulator DivK